MRVKKSFFTLILVTLLLINIFPQRILAYYNRGTVSLSLGTHNVSIVSGDKTNISVTLDPSSRTGLVGCGMPDCPQNCGGGCGNEVTGECPCAGNEMVTKKATATVQSSNGTIAKATYSESSGKITVTALNPGTVTITVIGSLWQYTDSESQNITVTVTEKTSESNPDLNNPQKSTNNNESTNNSQLSQNTVGHNGSSTSGSNLTNQKNNNNSGGAVIKGGESPKNTNSQVQDNPNSHETVKNDKTDIPDNYEIDANMLNQKVEIITLETNGTTKKEKFSQMKSENDFVIFQKKDSNDNVLYSWTFSGNDIASPMDLDMTINFPDNDIKGVSDCYYLSFNHDGPLPGKGIISVHMPNKYSDGDTLKLYLYDPETEDFQLLSEDVKVKAGYASFELTHCSDYILTTSLINSNERIKRPNIYMLSALILIVLLSAYLIAKNKKKKRPISPK